jgi:hypothetical protein
MCGLNSKIHRVDTTIGGFTECIPPSQQTQPCCIHHIKRRVRHLSDSRVSHCGVIERRVIQHLEPESGAGERAD